MREGLAEKKDALAAESPYDDFGFQLCRLQKSVFEDAYGKYGEHLFLNPE
jgi:hypothetical protein